MRLLLDTHAVLWWGNADSRLTKKAIAAVASPDAVVFVSAVSAIEVAIKHRLGKLPDAGILAAQFETQIEALGFLGLPISLAHARLAGGLAIPHRDPFDRLLIAQAMIDGLTVVSNEKLFDAFGVNRIW